jgi:hypothetical protein
MFLTNPSQLATVLLLLTGAVVEASTLRGLEECCTEKMVGNVSYTLLPDTFHGELPRQCLKSCVYTVSDTSSPMFCFAKGDLPTRCLSDGGTVDCTIECRAKIMAAEAECSSSSDKLECIIRVLVEDNEAACISCICDVLGGGGGGDPTECLSDLPGLEETDASSGGCIFCAVKIALAIHDCLNSPEKLQCMKDHLPEECLGCICSLFEKRCDSGSGSFICSIYRDLCDSTGDLPTDFLSGGTPSQLSVTCDNVTKVYFDGTLQSETDTMKNWNETSRLNIPVNTSVIAIECKTLGGAKGILASTSTDLETDQSWQCSSVYVDGWTLPGFIPPPNTFGNANSLGPNGVAPWGLRTGISTAANWIWPVELSDSTQAYCRPTVKKQEQN